MEHPGKELEKKIIEVGMTKKELSLRTGVSEKHICTIINGDRPISLAFARKLGYVFETSKYWIDAQLLYENEQAEIKDNNSISDEEIRILRILNEVYQYFISIGILHNACGDAKKVMQLRGLLKISDLTQIPKITYNAAYRAQLSSNLRVNAFVLFAWQRLCEIQTEQIKINQVLDKAKLKKSLNKIKALMFGNIKSVTGELQRIFADCGIAFSVVKNFRGAPVQGFIKKEQNNRLILCLTIRGQRADVFWFTLFHEIAHILNDDYNARFVDFDTVDNMIEIRADKFARDFLINPEHFREFVARHDYSMAMIERFAKEENVQPYIVIGRLQKEEELDWNAYSSKIERYLWA